jgi:hypothetical protein
VVSGERRKQMLDLDTFLTTLYVTVDDFCKANLREAPHPGHPTALAASEVITLALLGQFWRFRSEREFYRYAQRHLKRAFPTLPARTQFNREVRHRWKTLVAFGQGLVDRLQAQQVMFEVLDSVPVPVRNCKRRGRGWLGGLANIGWSTRLGWYNGFRGLIAVNALGVITGFAFCAANEKDQPLADTFLALRRWPQAALPTVGRYTAAWYLADNGFEGAATTLHWKRDYAATVLAAPAHKQEDRWPRRWWLWFKSLRQIVETVYDKLENWFGLGRDRNHELSGFHVRFAAKVTLHNFLIYLNRQLGRPAMAFADLLDW